MCQNKTSTIGGFSKATINSHEDRSQAWGISLQGLLFVLFTVTKMWISQGELETLEYHEDGEKLTRTDMVFGFIVRTLFALFRLNWSLFSGWKIFGGRFDLLWLGIHYEPELTQGGIQRLSNYCSSKHVEEGSQSPNKDRVKRPHWHF